MLTLEEGNENNSRFLIRNHGGNKAIFFECWGKKTVYPKFYTQQNCSSLIKGKSRHSPVKVS